MNIINKIIIVVILLAIIAVLFLAIINEFAGFFQWSDIAENLFNPARNIPAWASVLALLFIIALCIYLIYLELRIRRAKIARIHSVETGKAMITVETIAKQIKDEVLSIDGIKNLKVDAIPKSGGVIISMLVELLSRENVSSITTGIIKVAEETAVKKLDIKVVDTRVVITNLIPEETFRKSAKPVGAGQGLKEEQKTEDAGQGTFPSATSEEETDDNPSQKV